MSDPPSRLAAFLAELKHRRVFRVAVVYAGVAFILVQIVDGTFDPMGIPVWVSRLIILLLVLGFPIAVALAWAFDITDKGIVRTKGKPSAPTTPHHIVIGNKSLAVIAVLAIIVAAWALLRQPSPVGTAISSIAVLPLANLMGDPEQEYFVDGMHEALTVELLKISALRVIGRTSTMSYKANPKPIPEIAEELDVDAVIEGSVFQDGDLVRITAQLVATRPERHFWANDYEGDLTDILSLQKTIARAIAGEIGLALKPEEEADLASAPQVSPEAYNLYLKGWHFRNLHNHSKAVEYLEQAVALDSTFARAWAGLAYCYFWKDYGVGLMKQALDKALDLDPAQPLAHAYLGFYQQIKWEFVAADASFRRALELDPNNVSARDQYGWFLQRTGRPDEGLAEFRRIQELDPLSHRPPWGIAGIYSNTREYNKALEYGQAASELQPGFADRFINRTNREILMQQGRYAEAAAAAEQAGDLFRQLRAEWALGNREKVYAVRDSLSSTGELQQREQENPLWSAQLYAIMGEKELALGLLERAYEDTTKEFHYYTGLVYYPEFDSLRAESRFKALMQKIGLREVLDQNGQRIR